MWQVLAKPRDLLLCRLVPTELVLLWVRIEVMKPMRTKHIIVTCVLLFPCRVVNSDNMSIIGVTIDYGPYGFLDYYDPNYLSQSSGEYQVNCSQYQLTRGSSCFYLFWHYEINERKFSPIFCSHLEVFSFFPFLLCFYFPFVLLITWFKTLELSVVHYFNGYY